MTLLCKIIGHAIRSFGDSEFCIRCGKDREVIKRSIKRNIFGQIKKAQIIKKEDDIEELLKP